MQTFLPYEDFYKSAEVLDNKRLGKQRVECLQIFNAITKDTGWRHHPIVNMWRGHEDWLFEYTRVICNVWREKGFQDTVHYKIASEFPEFVKFKPKNKPVWLGNFYIHRSHKSNLYRKDPLFYDQFSRTPSVPYTWYSHEKGYYLGEFQSWEKTSS